MINEEMASKQCPSRLLQGGRKHDDEKSQQLAKQFGKFEVHLNNWIVETEGADSPRPCRWLVSKSVTVVGPFSWGCAMRFALINSKAWMIAKADKSFTHPNKLTFARLQSQSKPNKFNLAVHIQSRLHQAAVQHFHTAGAMSPLSSWTSSTVGPTTASPVAAGMQLQGLSPVEEFVRAWNFIMHGGTGRFFGSEKALDEFLLGKSDTITVTTTDGVASGQLRKTNHNLLVEICTRYGRDCAEALA